MQMHSMQWSPTTDPDSPASDAASECWLGGAGASFSFAVWQSNTLWRRARPMASASALGPRGGRGRGVGFSQLELS
eukprot:287190-Prymnesium_polylepis.1